jgi:hypothetical protein
LVQVCILCILRNNNNEVIPAQIMCCWRVENKNIFTYVS